MSRRLGRKIGRCSELARPVASRRQSTKQNSFAISKAWASCSQGPSRGTGAPPNSSLASQAVPGRPPGETSETTGAQMNWSLLREPRMSTDEVERVAGPHLHRRHVHRRLGVVGDGRTDQAVGGCSRSTRGPRRRRPTSWISVEPTRTVPSAGAVQRRTTAWSRSFPACPPSAVKRAQPRPPSGQLGPPCHSLPVKWGSGRKFASRPASASNAA